jgi:deoxyribonuclease V
MNNNFNINKEEMEIIQNNLREKILIQPLVKEPKIICGVDLSYHKNKAIAVIVSFDYESLSEISMIYEVDDINCEYMPGFLAFRELPLFLKAWSKLNIDPDLVFFDGNGILHPRRMGIATHASFYINKPTIGNSKTHFIGEYKEPKLEKGAYEYIYDNNEVIGAIVRTRENIKPIYVSIGNFITLEEAIKHTLHFATNDSRISKVTRIADLYSKELKRTLFIE